MSPKQLHRKDEHFLARFFNPESVAIVGASNNPMRVNYHLVANLIKLGFKGRIYPVHPSEKEIQGLKAYPAVKDIPETVDLAVIGVSYAVTPDVLMECVDKGIKQVTLIAGGFSEAGGLSLIFQSGLYEPRSGWLLTDFNYHLALAIQIHPEILLFPKELMGIFHRASDAGKPIALWLAGMEPGRHENLSWIEDKGVPVFSCPEKAVAALAALHRLSRS